MGDYRGNISFCRYMKVGNPIKDPLLPLSSGYPAVQYVVLTTRQFVYYVSALSNCIM